MDNTRADEERYVKALEDVAAAAADLMTRSDFWGSVNVAIPAERDTLEEAIAKLRKTYGYGLRFPKKL